MPRDITSHTPLSQSDPALVPPDLLQREAFGLPPRFQRLLVAGAAGGGTKQAFRNAYDLYQRGDPFLLDSPGKLTVSSILREVDDLVR